MKPSPLFASPKSIQANGILRQSTLAILAGGMLSGLSSCDSSNQNQAQDFEREATRQVQQAQAAAVQARTQLQQLLKSGMIPNNFELKPLGFYHAASQQFFPTAYNQKKADEFFVNGAWQKTAGPTEVPASKPTPETLAAIDTALAALAKEEEAQAANLQNSHHSRTHHHHHSGFANGLMMYWLLSGNRGGGYQPGPGFQYGNRQASQWQQQSDRQFTQRQNHTANSIRSKSAPSSSSRNGFGMRSSSSSS